MQPAIDPTPPASQNAAMEARIARLETHVEHLNANVADLRVGLARLEVKVAQGFSRLDAKIDRHFLVMGGMIVSLGVGMAGLTAKGFHWL